MTAFQEAKDKFILHWGEMGTKWGINRTMAQVQALLFISEEALSAEDIMEELQISRGNVSMSLRELVNWGIVTKMHIKGERKEYFTTEKDVFEFFKIVSRERKKREIDPTIIVLREVIDDMASLEHPQSQYARQKLSDMLELVEMGDKLYNYIEDLRPKSLIKLIKQIMKFTPGKNTPE